MNKSARMFGAALLIAVAGAAANASADVTARGGASSLDATVIFQRSGSDLMVTLLNSSSADVLSPEDVLTGVFFNISGPTVPLVAQSAALSEGSMVRWGDSEMGGGVGGEWAFRAGLSGAPGGATYGISAAGLGLFGPHDAFPGANLFGQNGPQGLDYGLLSAGDNPLTGNTPVTGQFPLIQSGVVFTLSGLPEDFELGAIGNVWVQYGTSLSEPSYVVPIISVPAPGAAVMLAGGAFALARRRRAA
ncbi:MAG: hypothetical protein KF699_04460 [Phycisphaeraceae bacterium]|nr:hypothetical protein [Phycisphaeraceae bacterium]